MQPTFFLRIFAYDASARAEWGDLVAPRERRRVKCERGNCEWLDPCEIGNVYRGGEMRIGFHADATRNDQDRIKQLEDTIHAMHAAYVRERKVWRSGKASKNWVAEGGE